MTWRSAIFATIVIIFPLIYRTVRGAFEAFDEALAYSSKTLGLSNTCIFWRIRLPYCRQGILAGTVLAFARALGEYDATSMIAGYTPGKTATISTAASGPVRAAEDNLQASAAAPAAASESHPVRPLSAAGASAAADVCLLYAAHHHGHPDGLQKLSECREAGYAIENGEYKIGLCSIFAPVFTRDGTVAYTTGVIGMFRSIHCDEFAAAVEQVRATASMISAALGYRPDRAT